LYAPDGGRKYVNSAELGRVIAATNGLDQARSLFTKLLVYTGARVSEALALTPNSFQLETGVVTFVTLKRRKHCLREVPVPADFMRALDRHFNIRGRQQSRKSWGSRLWEWCRTTAWRIIKKVMEIAQVFGRQACPRGLRHGFGVGMLISKVELPLIQRWMGHARIGTTTIYTQVCGPEAIALAQPFWETLHRHAQGCAHSSMVGASWMRNTQELGGERDLAHGYGFGLPPVQSGELIHLVQRWIAHARPRMTAIYNDVCGAEEIALAKRFWRGTIETINTRFALSYA
jgi:hypothetical protein